MIQNKTISLIIPCKNEAKIIGNFICRVPKYVDEIIVVDNNSTDNTAVVAEKAGARVIKETRAIDGIGYGYAHMRGMKEATGDYVVAMDGDDTYPMDAIQNVVRTMEGKKLDFVSCNRLPLINPKAISPVRQLGIRLLNMTVWILYGYPICDILTGMWIMRKNIASELNIKSGDWNLSPEIKLAAIQNPLVAFAEYHINHYQREKEPSKQNILKTGFNHLFYILIRRVTDDSALYQLAKQWAKGRFSLPYVLR